MTYVHLILRMGERAFFIFGFVKNRQNNINPKEAKAIKLLVREFLGYTDDDLKKALEAGELVEISYE
ncbi:type II toxin-antitoxin system RelE/ParE family toxin [Endozoicomonas sp. 4G]|uniref:type II toxin-antitoxin system RelE/ParE family toxin n=1 Tax=Endozoicomonas sp. 4G TaxID=2872754 RepID=UPI002078DFE0|nr:type II toxin-antitoxin system RelE/ParE family toxin [Endozoicomonas sp. 4G]